MCVGYPPSEARRRRRYLRRWQPNPCNVRESAYDAKFRNRQNFKLESEASFEIASEISKLWYNGGVFWKKKDAKQKESLC